MSDERYAAAKAGLRAVIEKLEPLEAQYLAFLPGEFLDPARNYNSSPEQEQRYKTGLFYLRAALVKARLAVMSEDEAWSGDCLEHCQTLFSDGRMLFQQHLPTARQRVGGKKTAAKATAAAEQRYQKYIDLLNVEILQRGKTYRQACSKVRAEMWRNDFQVPSAPTWARWFPDPTKNNLKEASCL